MGYDFVFEDRSSVVYPVHGEAEFILSIDGQPVCARLTKSSIEGEAFLDIDGRRERIFTASRGDVHYVHLQGRAHRIEAINALDRARHDAAPSGGAEILRAPMPGVVVDVTVEEGAEVESGQLLMTIESMKLQTAIRSPHRARVVEIHLVAGASFDQGAALIRLESNEEEGECR